MKDSAGVEWFTIAQAALAVGRKRRAIERWLENGMPSQRVRGVRYISERDLFARLRLILATEPEVKTRHERPEAQTAIRRTPPHQRNGTHLRVMAHDGRVVREGEVFDWIESRLFAPPGYLARPPHPAAVPGRFSHRVWFVGDDEPVTFTPDDYETIFVTRRSEDEKSDDAPV